MSGIIIEINTEGFEKIEQALSRLEKAAGKELPTVLEVIGSYLDSDVVGRFEDSEGPVDGVLQPWKPITEQTAIARLGGKRKVYRKNGDFRIKGGISQGDRLSSQSPLLDHGHLLKSITHNVNGNVLEHGSSMEYSPFHQFGTETIDARPFLGLTEDNEEDILKIVRDHLNEALD